MELAKDTERELKESFLNNKRGFFEAKRSNEAALKAITRDQKEKLAEINQLFKQERDSLKAAIDTAKRNGPGTGNQILRRGSSSGRLPYFVPRGLWQAAGLSR